MQRRIGGVRLVLALIWLLSVSAPTSALPTAAISGAPGGHAPTANGIVVEPQLQAQIEAQGSASYLIYFRERPELAAAAAMSWHDRGWFVYKALRDAADRSQGRVRAYLEKQGVKYRAFWIDNVIAVERSDRVVLNGLLSFPEIAALRAARTLKLIEPIKAKAAPTAVQAIEPNITHVGAPTAWAQGITGQGIVVASIDTGVRYSHQALVGHYRGNLGNGAFDHNYNWWDPYGDHPGAPADDNGHGTHTMGTMVGSDSGANQIGMAPGAQWIACRGCSTSDCTDVALLECAQFMVAPWDLSQSNPDPDRRPHVVNNSWGDCGTAYDGWFQGVIDAWHAAGVYPIFSNGNNSNCGYSSPPPCGTVGNPARYGNVTGVGSTGRDDGQYASHSNRGPTDHPDTVNPRGFPTIKPQVAAPGVYIRSAVPYSDDSYEGGWSGTSMSAPHVSGLVALIWQAAPCLRGNYATTETLIEQSATPITTGLPGACSDEGPGQLPNQSTGWGEINAATAVQAALQACGDSVLTGRVTEAATLQAAGDPIPHAIVQVWSNPADVRTTNVDAQGYYTLTVFGGVYTVAAQAYGYLPTQVSSVAVSTGSVTTQDLALTPTPRHTIAGRVVDARTGWPLYAQIMVRGDPIGPPAPADSVWTDPVTGRYSITLAQGPAYTLAARAWVAGYTPGQRSVATLASDRTEDFALDNDATCSAPGYHLDLVYREDFEADDGGFKTMGATSWAWGAPTSGPGAAHSGVNAWATNLTGNYGDNEDGALVSPSIDLSAYAGQTPALVWQQWLQTEEGYDFVRVEASKDGGATWATVYGPISGAVDLQWARRAVFLDPSYAVAGLRVRFVFVSDGSLTEPGWYVDDVGVGVVDIPPPIIAFAHDFEADDGGFTTMEVTSWAWGAPTSGPSAAHSGAKAWATNLDGDYSNDEDGALISPVIDLSAHVGLVPILTWQQWLSTERYFDFASVDVSKDGGATWATVYGPVSGDVSLQWHRIDVPLPTTYATDAFRFRFSFVSDSSIQGPGWYVDDVAVAMYEPSALELPCLAPTGGLIVGEVVDANTGAALAGATVAVDGRQAAVSAATPAGFFTFYAPEGSRQITASKAPAYGEASATASVPAGGAVRQDLALPAGRLTAQPSALQVIVRPGGSALVPLTVSNSGGRAATFAMAEISSTALVTTGAPAITDFPRGADAPSLGRAPSVNGTSHQLTQGIAVGAPGFAVELVEENFLAFTTDAPADATIVGPISDGEYYGGDFLGDEFSREYVLDAAANHLLSVDVATGAATDIGPATPLLGQTWTGLAGDPTTGTLFASSCDLMTSQLYRIDPATGATTPIGPITNAPCVIGIAASPAGELYALDIFSNRLLRVDKTTGASTVIGSVGFDANYAQGMDFDDATHTLYLAAYNNATYEAELRIADTTTGATTVVGLFPSGTEIDAPAFATSADVPWLSVSPVTGTVAPGGAQAVQVHFDASVVSSPGRYEAALQINSDTPYAPRTIPVTMIVDALDRRLYLPFVGEP